LGFGGHSKEDRDLGYKIAEIGEFLRLGIKRKEDVGKWIRDNIGVKNPVGIARSVITDKLAPYKKKFRVFEYENNGDVLNKWKLDDDMKKYVCSNNTELYYQDYEYFYFNDIDRGESRVVAFGSEDEKDLIFLYGDDLNQYKSVAQVCDDLEILKENNKYVLHIDFFSLIENYLKKGKKDKPFF